MSAEPSARLSFRQAIVDCTPRHLATNVLVAEHPFGPERLLAMGYMHLGVGLDMPDRDTVDAERGSATALARAWKAVIEDLRFRIDAGELFLSGVQIAPDERPDPEPIPSAWVAVLEMDPHRATARGMGRHWTAVRLSKVPLVPAAPPPTLHRLDVITPGSVANLSDDVILALLEEHAKRVVEGPDAKLIAPGKISLLPILKRKLEWRAAQGAMLPRLSDEAEVLADWIATKVSSHPVPTASTIGKVLGGAYAALRARSNAAIQLPRD